MAVNLSIKNASDEVIAALKSRKTEPRSVPGEMMAIIEEAAVRGLGSAEARPAAIAWRAGTGVAAQSQTRPQSIEQAVALMRDGLSLGGRCFTREELHER